MSNIPCRVGVFLSATEGNWRNAIYIECKEPACPYAEHCSSVLFAADLDGTPILLPSSEIQVCCGQAVDKHDCSGCLDKSAFIAAYRRYLDWNINADGICAFRTLLDAQRFPICKGMCSSQKSVRR